MTTDDLEKKLKDINVFLQLNCFDGEPIAISFNNVEHNQVIFSFADNSFDDENLKEIFYYPHMIDSIKHDIRELVSKYITDEYTPGPPVTSLDNPFKSYTDHLADILLQKNKAYGDSFTKSIDDYGLSVIGIRLSDKYNRIHHLITKGELKENDESLKDTLLDMAGYSILALKYLDNIKITKFYGNNELKDTTVKNFNKEKGNE